MSYISYMSDLLQPSISSRSLSSCDQGLLVLLFFAPGWKQKGDCAFEIVIELLNFETLSDWIKDLLTLETRKKAAQNLFF